MKILFGCLLLACAVTPALAQIKSLVHKDEKRRYLVYTPPAYDSQPARHFPVVFNFHGGGMTMAEQMLYTGMNRAADKHGFIVVYPAGLKQDWNVGFGMPYLEGGDDTGFTAALLAKLQRDYRIDSTRVYATGLSRGGFFALRLAADLPHLFAAVASVGGPMPEPVVQHHTKPGNVGVLLVHGTADQVVAYGGKPGGYLSVEESYRYWSKRLGIDSDGGNPRVIDTDATDGTSVTWQEQSNGQQSVALVTVRDGGHTWPGADPFNVGHPLGRTTHDIDGNDVIWRFFGTHRRPE